MDTHLVTVRTVELVNLILTVSKAINHMAGVVRCYCVFSGAVRVGFIREPIVFYREIHYIVWVGRRASL